MAGLSQAAHWRIGPGGGAGAAGSASLLLAGAALLPSPAQAAFLHGETLDAVADVAAWVVLVVAPIVGVGLFWIVHIIPERIAEKKGHPQAKAIQALCLLSLVFGGWLWPLAMVWATAKPLRHEPTDGRQREQTDPGKALPKERQSPPIQRETREALNVRIERFEQELASLRSRVQALDPAVDSAAAEQGRPQRADPASEAAAVGVPAVERKG